MKPVYYFILYLVILCLFCIACEDDTTVNVDNNANAESTGGSSTTNTNSQAEIVEQPCTDCSESAQVMAEYFLEYARLQASGGVPETAPGIPGTEQEIATQTERIQNIYVVSVNHLIDGADPQTVSNEFHDDIDTVLSGEQEQGQEQGQNQYQEFPVI